MAMQSEQLGLPCNNFMGLSQVPRWDEPMKVGKQEFLPDFATTETVMALAHENARLTNEIMNMHAAFGPLLENPGYVDYEGYDAGYCYDMNFGLHTPPGLYVEPSYVHAGLSSSAKSVRRKNSPRKIQPKKAQGGEGRKGVDSTFDVSTVAGSSPPVSIVTSRNHSRVPSTDGDNIEKPESLEVGQTVGQTTVMMRNLPNDYTRDMVLELLRSNGYEGKFDFIYLPIDFQRKAGLGYAFINFVDSEVAEEFQKEFTGFRGWSVTSEKMCEVSWSAVQGLQTHIDRYRNNPVMHESVPEEYRPQLYAGSEIVTFPPPTKSIRAPRHWNRRQRETR